MENMTFSQSPALPRLDGRLRSALLFVRPGAFVADVGTDHAYLPVYLMATGQASGAVASDIHEGPIARARAHIAAFGLSGQIATVCTDGLSGLAAYRPTDILIFGMGGELIVRILTQAPWVKDPAVRLILQPMTHAETVRRYLAQEGFATVGEVLSCDGRRIYQTLAAAYDGTSRPIEALEAELGRFKNASSEPEEEGLRQAFLRHRIEILKTALQGKNRSQGGASDAYEREMIEKIGACL